MRCADKGGDMRAYKITDINDCTYKGFQWRADMVHKTSGKGELCTGGWIHFYRDKRLAVLLNPVHGKYNPIHLWLGEASGEIKDDSGLKYGCSEFRMIKRVRIPKITETQKIAFGILCSLEVYDEPGYVQWAKGWLQNKDRSLEAARTAEAAGVAAWTVEGAWAARTAAWIASETATEQATVLTKLKMTAIAEMVAEASKTAAEVEGKKLNLPKIATEAMKY